jgi:hypothetical protein
MYSISMATITLTRDIGEAERTLRALLERQLAGAGLSFPEWAVLSFLDGAPLDRGELVRRQLRGSVVRDLGEAESTVDGLLASGLVAPRSGDALGLTDAGEARYQPVRQQVGRITDGLYRGLPAADVEATHRTLAEVARRAHVELAAAGD